ncbi:hypothetical protein RB213_005558 [Colletotrichum asianum]
MTITTPNNNGQLARWLNRKGDLCFEIAFFATAAISFVALGAFIIALSLVVGGLLVAGVILFCAADMMSEKVNKVAPRQQSQAQTKEMMKEKGTIKLLSPARTSWRSPGIVSRCMFCTALAFIVILVVILAPSARFYVGFYGTFGLIKGFRYLSNEVKERKAKK